MTRTLTQRIAAFGGLSLLASIAPLLVLPFVARSVSPQMWGTLLTCQALGQLMGLALLAGWGIDGQARVASTPQAHVRAEIYIASFRQRLRIAALILPATAVLGVVVSRGEAQATHALMALSGAWSGFGLSWFAVGSGRASWIAKFEALPKLAASTMAAMAVATTGLVWLYPTLGVAATTLGVLAFNRHLTTRVFPRSPQGSNRIRSAGLAAGSLSLFGAGYAGAPLPISQALSLDTAPQLATADRLYRYALFTVSSLANGLQQWVLSKSPHQKYRAEKIAFRLHLGLGAVGGLAFTFLAYPAGALLFGPAVSPSAMVAGGYGLAFFFVSTATPLTRNVLVPQGMTSRVLLLSVLSASAGVTGMILTGAAFGASGIAWSLAAADGLFLSGVAYSCRQVRGTR